MANNIATALERDGLMEGAMDAMREALPALRLFATSFNAQPLLRGSNKVLVEYHPLDTQNSKDFTYANGYQFDQNTDTAALEVEINKRKYKDLSFTSEELMRQPSLDPSKKGLRAGQKLMQDVFADILSVVTAANFPNAFPDTAATAFFADDLTDLHTICNKLGWPRMGRAAILDHDFENNLLKDNTFYQNAYGANGAIAEARLPRVSNFDIATTGYIPENGERLHGMGVYESAILTAFAPIAPAASGDTITYETYTDPDGSGATLEFREWFDRNADTMRRTIECNYGYAKGEANALVRIPTPA